MSSKPSRSQRPGGPMGWLRVVLLGLRGVVVGFLSLFAPSRWGRGLRLLGLLLLAQMVFGTATELSKQPAPKIVMYSTFNDMVRENKVGTVIFEEGGKRLRFSTKGGVEAKDAKGARGGKAAGKAKGKEEAETASKKSDEVLAEDVWTVQRIEGDRDLIPLLSKHGVRYGAEAASLSKSIQRVLMTALMLWIPLLPLFFIMRRAMNGRDGGSKRRQSSPRDDNGAPRVTFKDVAGVPEAKEELMEVVNFLRNPGKYRALGAKLPSGVLLVGPPGTGKTLLARAVANNLDCNFLKVVSSAIVDKYIGESARLIREMFAYADENQPCVIFLDEIDAIGGKRFSEGTSADREIQRTLMELLSQLDGFDKLGKVKMICATNRPDVLDPALLRPGRLDRKIEIPLPNEAGRVEVLKIHSAPMTKHGEIDYEQIAKLAENFNAADLRNVCTEAGMFAIRARKKTVSEKDFLEAVEKVIKGYKKFSSTAKYMQYN
uniref:AAA+ ATPase domain-containing protein n=1 Tax=Prasinoderma singulare TaxID=676789 RepID=A0A7S3FDA8_9VIRI